MGQDSAIVLLGEYLAIDMPRACDDETFNLIRARQDELLNRMLKSGYSPLVAVAIKAKRDRGTHNCRKQIDALLDGQ